MNASLFALSKKLLRTFILMETSHVAVGVTTAALRPAALRGQVGVGSPP